MLQEIPCRDTDPDPGAAAMDIKDEDRDSPVAFTINFGGEQGNEEEKNRKLERFALRSSQRKPRSPRMEPRGLQGAKTKLRGMVSEPLQKTFLREKSELRLREHVEERDEAGSRRLTTVISPGREKIDFTKDRRMTTSMKKEEEDDYAADSFDDKEESEEEAVRMSRRKDSERKGRGREEEESERRRRGEEESEGRRRGEEEESAPSETGTYTVDKDNEEEELFQPSPLSLASLEGPAGDKSSYVAEWASKHAFTVDSKHVFGPPSPPGCGAPLSLPHTSTSTSTSRTRASSPRARASSPRGASSLSCKSRRKLPATPHSQPNMTSPEALAFSPESSMSPPRQEDSEDDESSFMTHTQHLVDVMEARINQKTVQKTNSKSTKSVTTTSSNKSKPARRQKSLGGAKSTPEAGDQDQAAMEAWQRRKNYDPMAAAGKKKEVSRKHSSSSMRSNGVKSPQEPQSATRYPSPVAMAKKLTNPSSAPSSAVSRSSDSSGYLSRTEGARPGAARGEGPRAGSVRSEGARPGSLRSSSGAGAGGGLATRTAPAPLRKLVHTASSSSLKLQGARSTSSLTSREAEFQAWKRRKEYNPLAAARKTSSPGTSRGSSASSQPKSAYSPSPTEPLHNPPQHHRVRQMTQSLVMEEGGSLPIHRSGSFHYPGTKSGRGPATSEDDSGDDYGSGCDSSAAEGGGSLRANRKHFYLDDDELILPIGRPHGSQARLADRSLYGSASLSPQVSPSKSRTKQLEALDNLVISTIYNVSSKLCASSSSVLRKTVAVLPEQEEEQASTVETVLYLLDDVDLPSTPAKKTSRELSGTLRNLKKVEQALELLNKVLELEENQ